MYNRKPRPNSCCLRLSGAPLESADLTAPHCVQERCHGDVATGLGRLIMPARRVTPDSAFSTGAATKHPPAMLQLVLLPFAVKVVMSVGLDLYK